jgi:hypothetical protein
MAYVNDMGVHDAITALLDLLSSEPDPAVRLTLVNRALRTVRTDLTALRDATAFEARSRYGISELERITGVNHGSISVWIQQHAARTGAPYPRRRSRLEGMLVHDLARLPADRRDSVQRRGRVVLRDTV